MKYTLLELTQTVLSSLDGEEINSISDNPESLQVVKIIKTVYNDIISRSGLPMHKTPFTLTASTDIAKPTLMTKPSNITNIEWLKYDCQDVNDTDPVWRDMQYLPVEEFLLMGHNLSPSNSDVDTMTLNLNGFNLVFNFRNDAAPAYFTSFEDNTIVFNSYNSAIDSTLQSNKTLGYGERDLAFLETDTFVPELQPDQFALLLSEATSLAWIELKQSPHVKAEQTAKRNWSHLARARNHIVTGRYGSGVHTKDLTPNFGRK